VPPSGSRQYNRNLLWEDTGFHQAYSYFLMFLIQSFVKSFPQQCCRRYYGN
jgi:hypothetical protein